ncbi:MAG: polysaccharide deacetylase family protein [Chloroflexota bacterium]|nr:polysaccharide deacetylase family protein [Chloroflexota bacterium]
MRRPQALTAPGLPGVTVLAAIAIAASPVYASPLRCAVAAAIAFGCWALSARVRAPRLIGLLGLFGALVSAWLLAQASYYAAAWFTAPALGVGIGLVSGAASGAPGGRRPAGAGGWKRGAAAAAVASLVVAGLLVGVRALFGRDGAMAAGAAYVAFAGAAALLAMPGRRWRAVALAPAAAFSLLLPGVTAAYIGATTPRATWFGSLTSHGPRTGNEVAITFDDGPNPPYTEEIAAILDAHGVKGTFFTVGKALDKRPDASRALMADGHLLGNHSYLHDAVRWLDPRYPELQRAQDAFKRNLGVCPAFYRPPHGSHTPFIAHVVADHGMTMITWDDSAGDWATNDGQLVARRILKGVRPGSIILLHDGIDGNIGANRTVILQALPIILDGLKARGLQPVRLDKLLGKPGYVPC